MTTSFPPLNTLVIYAHPHRDSLNGAFLRRTLESLGARPDRPEVRVIDLYEQKFDPVLVFGPEKRRRDMHRDPDLAKYRNLILWADHLVFLYPIFWGRPPAMVLGFIDRLFSTHFAYRNIPGKSLPEGLLAGRSVTCISTMKGPPGYLQYWLWNAHRVLMKKAVFRYVGIKRVDFFEFGEMEKEGGRQESALDRVGRYFRTLRLKNGTKVYPPSLLVV